MGHETLVWPLSLFGSRHAGVPLPVSGSEGDSGGKFEHLARDVKPAAPSSGLPALPSVMAVVALPTARRMPVYGRQRLRARFRGPGAGLFLGREKRRPVAAFG